jgi:thioredoxin-dependent peroxiredoxin
MSGKVSVGKKVPEATLLMTGAHKAKLSDFRGRHLVLYFYPRDNTPGCTTEGEDFRDQYKRYQKLDTAVLGVSRDSLASHENFKAKFKFPFDLVSDEDEKLCKLFDVIREKVLYGKKHLGVDRSTFLIDKDGVLRKEFRGVKVTGHVQEVLEEIEKL